MSGRDPRATNSLEPARGGGRRVSPGFVFLLVAVIGSVAYMAYVITVRDNSQIPLMASGAGCDSRRSNVHSGGRIARHPAK